ncbi:hypothetical protein M0R89_22845 (plasmid) [Halorussus limi]|uniref:Uncharacterized protein n=1 Tax=Halorussus limi TaxID=2938695 RepID=A0A8U0I194_9EURY|nr:hypothetical protein [Halorussus limi]UPV77212.1 hypothetical protein M0R89_22845 [Halorussus limi]
MDEDDFPAAAESQVQSWVRTATTIRLDKYRNHGLVDIIRGRVEAGLLHGAAAATRPMNGRPEDN